MYNLAKLLTEEPEKLERLGILFLKLLVTLFIGSAYFGFNFSITCFIDNPIPKDYTISKFIFFVISLVLIWFIVWSIFADLLLGEVLIWLLSKIGNKKLIFTDVLSLLSVVKKNNQTLSPDKNVIEFNEMLHSYSDEGEKVMREGKSRARQYFIVSSVIYISLLFAKDINLSATLKWVGGIFTLNFLIASVVFNQIHKYFNENLDEMKKEFSKLSFVQMVINSIDQNTFIKIHYERKGRWQKIGLKRKNQIEWLPESFTIFPLYNLNESLTQELLKIGLIQRSNKNIMDEKENTHYDVLICNVKPNEENIKIILSQHRFVYLYCENNEQCFKNIEILLFKVTNGHYRMDE